MSIFPRLLPQGEVTKLWRAKIYLVCFLLLQESWEAVGNIHLECLFYLLQKLDPFFTAIKKLFIQSNSLKLTTKVYK